MNSNKKPVALAVTTALLLSGSAFASTPLAQGYQLGADTVIDAKAAEGNCGGDKAQQASCGANKATGEAKCGADKPAAEGKCGGEGKCGFAMMDTDKDGKISKAEFAAAHGGKDDKFAGHDTNKDGFISADEFKAAHEGKCGEGKCGEGKCGEGKCGGDKPKAQSEGKCGEGKCGGMA